MLFGLFQRKAKPQIEALHADLVSASRAIAPYRDFGVADTFEGRFEYLTLVSTLLLERLSQLGAEGNTVGQALVDRIFASLDDAFRNIGVSDIAVGKRVKKLAKSFYGRAGAYRQGLRGDELALREALARNLYGGTRSAQDVPSGLLTLLTALRTTLDQSDLARLLAGGLLVREKNDEA